MPIIRRLCWTLLLLGIAWAGLIVSQLLPRPAAQDSRNIAALAPQPGDIDDPDNGFAALWTIAHDLDDAQARAQTRADLATANPASDGEPGAWPQTGTDPHLCRDGGACLDRVRQHRDSVHASLQRHALLLQRIIALQRYHRVRTPAAAASLDRPLIGASLSALPLSAAALAFVDGDRNAGLAQVCRFSRTWRDLRRQTDQASIDLAGITYLSEAAALFARMLAELPQDAALPPLCSAAFAPLSDAETDHCAIARSEFAATMRILDTPGLAGSTHDLVGYRFINRRHVQAALAARHAYWCSDEHLQRRQTRQPAAAEASGHCRFAERIYDPLGCMVVDVAATDLRAYQRVLDLDRLLQLTAALLRGRQRGDTGAGLITRAVVPARAAH